MNWTIATGIVAVYGALLSTWSAVSAQLEKRRHVTIKISYGFPTFGPELGPASIIVTALNKGHTPVTLSNAGIRWPDGRTTVCFEDSGNTKFPQELEGGKSCFVLIEIQLLARQLKIAGFSGTVTLNGFFRDALDKTYTGKFDFDVEESLKET